MIPNHILCTVYDHCTKLYCTLFEGKKTCFLVFDGQKNNLIVTRYETGQFCVVVLWAYSVIFLPWTKYGIFHILSIIWYTLFAAMSCSVCYFKWDETWCFIMHVQLIMSDESWWKMFWIVVTNIPWLIMITALLRNQCLAVFI